MGAFLRALASWVMSHPEVVQAVVEGIEAHKAAKK
jgi:hypothetical protein